MSSFARSATKLPSSCLNVTPAGTGVLRVPFGPFTSSWLSLIFTVTPAGIVIGFFPTRDITLINLCQNLAADVFRLRTFAAHQPARGGNDVDAVTAEHPRDLASAYIDSASGARHSRKMRDRRGAFRIVAKENANHVFRAF